jgi:hypothetical protein
MAARVGVAGIREMGEVMGNSRRNRVVAALGAGGMLVTVLGATGAPAQASTPPKACVAIEAMVGDGVSGPGLGGEVLRVTPGGQSTLTTNSSPPGSPPLDAPSDMAFLPNGDIVVTDEGVTGGTQLLRIDPATGDRVVLSANGTGTGPTMTGSSVGLENGVIYLMDQNGTIMSVNPVNGNRALISGPGRGGGPGFVFPVSMASDSPNSVVVLDMEQRPSGPGFGLGALIRVDLATGDRTVLSVDGTPKGSPVFDTPIDVRYDACEKAFYVLQTGFTPSTPPGKILKVDAVTGTRSLFATYRGAENYALLLRPIPVPPLGAGGGGGSGQPSNQ